jgi:hypothetical protein
MLRYHDITRATTSAYGVIARQMALPTGKEAKVRLVEVVTLRLPDKLVAELNKLTARMKKLPTTDGETFSRADAARIVIRRGIEELKKDIAKAERR